MSFYKCELCGTEYQMGKGIYNGKVLNHYQLNVCNTCYIGNHDGWSPMVEQAFETHLKKNGIPLRIRNENGYYPRDL